MMMPGAVRRLPAAAEVAATFTSAATVPVTAAGYTATGHTMDLSANQLFCLPGPEAADGGLAAEFPE
jgi:hypothetical protein